MCFVHYLLLCVSHRYSIGSCLSERGEVYLLGGVGRDLNVYLTQLKLETMSATTSDITEVRLFVQCEIIDG